MWHEKSRQSRNSSILHLKVTPENALLKVSHFIFVFHVYILINMDFLEFIDNLLEMTCAIWSLGQIPASLTVHWLKGNSYYFEEYKISLSISKQVKNYKSFLLQKPLIWVFSSSPCPTQSWLCSIKPLNPVFTFLLGHLKWLKIKQRNA